ncbi:hypothetical protein ACETU7_28595 [Rhodococcus sp. 3Y1]
MNFAGYAADYLRYLTGLDVTEVYAETSTLYGGAHQLFGVEDTALISLALENGVTATVTVGRIPAAPGFGANTATVRVLGSHGYASSDDDKPAVTHFASSGDVTALPIGGFGSDNAVSSFLSRARSTPHTDRTRLHRGRRPRVDARDRRCLSVRLERSAGLRFSLTAAPTTQSDNQHMETP